MQWARRWRLLRRHSSNSRTFWMVSAAPHLGFEIRKSGLISSRPLQPKWKDETSIKLLNTSRCRSQAAIRRLTIGKANL